VQLKCVKHESSHESDGFEVYDASSSLAKKLAAKAMLDIIANIMKKDKTLKIKIVAHTNNIGNETVNLKLSEKRALLAKAYLNKKGIPLNYVATAWKGGSEPMVSNDTKENRAKNKRLEVIFYIANVK
jgi:outer membrane protein OmpA-like peptidoglycan-associated protein